MRDLGWPPRAIMAREEANQEAARALLHVQTTFPLEGPEGPGRQPNPK